MTDEQLWAIENRALSVDEAVLSEAAEHYNPAGAAEADFADNAPQDVLALVAEVKALYQYAAYLRGADRDHAPMQYDVWLEWQHDIWRRERDGQVDRQE